LSQKAADGLTDFMTSMAKNVRDVVYGAAGYVAGLFKNEEGSDIGFCFPKGTLIKTKTGLKKIEDLIPGDLVLSYNHNLQKNEYKPIVRLFRKVTQTWIDIQFDIDKRLTATPGHQIYIKGEGYIDAIKVESGMKFIDSSFNEHLINDKLTREVNDEETYNFEVEGNHNYYVSQEEILVHNDSLKLAKIQALNYYQQKIERNEPLTQEEINNMDLLEADLGVGNYAKGITVKGKKTLKENDKITIALTGDERIEVLSKLQPKLVSKLDELVASEVQAYGEVKRALEAFKKNPNANTASNLADAYEETVTSMGIGATPYAGDILDGLIAVKDLYKGSYFAAGVSTVAAVVPFFSAPLAKKIVKALGEKATTFVKENKAMQWLAERFGKKADKYVDDVGNILDLNKFKNLEKIDTPIVVNRSGSNIPLNGKPNSVVSTTGGHKIIYDSNGRALYDVSSKRIKVYEWHKTPDGQWFSRQGRDTKMFKNQVPKDLLDLLE